MTDQPNDLNVELADLTESVTGADPEQTLIACGGTWCLVYEN